MAGNAIKAWRAKGRKRKAAKRRATTDLPHGMMVTQMHVKSLSKLPRREFQLKEKIRRKEHRKPLRKSGR